MRQLKHECGRVLDLGYVPRNVLSKDGSMSSSPEPALFCSKHGLVKDLTEVRPQGAMCVVREAS